MNSVNPELLIVTLGSEPQVITIALDSLLSSGHNIDRVAVVYTVAPVVLDALKRVKAEFESGFYGDITLDTLSLHGQYGEIQDFRNNSDVQALLQLFYQKIRDAKKTGKVVHLCISGGRKVMGIMAMVAAQLLFSPQDRVWHLITEGWRPGDDQIMHPADSQQRTMVEVPVLRWEDASLLLNLVQIDDPTEALRWQDGFARNKLMRRRKEFVERKLTRAERQVATLVCQGLDNTTIAAKLRKTERTVANQLTSVYNKLNEWLGFPDVTVGRSILIAELAPYFAIVKERSMMTMPRT
jgi:CRISPR-associated protein Csx14